MPSAEAQLYVKADIAFKAVLSLNGIARVSFVNQAHRTRTCCCPPLEVDDGPKTSIVGLGKRSDAGKNFTRQEGYLSSTRFFSHAEHTFTCL